MDHLYIVDNKQIKVSNKSDRKKKLTSKGDCKAESVKQKCYKFYKERGEKEKIKPEQN